jgi:hypothetical protein
MASNPTATFPNVIGCDLSRAKAIILSKLPYNRIVFRVVPSVPGKKNPVVDPASNEIVLMYNPKDNSVWTTPKFYGIIKTKPSNDDNEYQELSESEPSIEPDSDEDY